MYLRLFVCPTKRVNSLPDTFPTQLIQIGKVTMQSLSIRCRHEQVRWVGPNRCKCQSCHKVGHWFEAAGLVMWYRGETEPETAKAVFSNHGQNATVQLEAS